MVCYGMLFQVSADPNAKTNRYVCSKAHPTALEFTLTNRLHLQSSSRSLDRSRNRMSDVDFDVDVDDVDVDVDATWSSRNMRVADHSNYTMRAHRTCCYHHFRISLWILLVD